jgi:hypothetical protein
VLLPWFAFGACVAVLPAAAEPSGDGESRGDPEEASEGAADGAVVEPVEPAFPRPEGLDADAVLALEPDACLALLDRWGVPYERVSNAPESIRTPLRLAGPVAGVVFRVPWRVDRHQDVLDCRLAVAIAQWAALLADRGVTEVRIYSFHRNGNRNGVSSGGQLSQHHFGLAIDARWFVLGQEDVLDVEADFAAPPAADTCDGSVDDPRAALLLELYCAAWRERLFHVQLSPAHNRAHENHYHLDVGGGNGGRYLD